MFIFWNANNELARTPNGKRLNLTCGKCSQKATFYECKIDESLKLYFLVEIWKRTKRVLQCGECLACCDYYEVFPQEKPADEKTIENDRKQQEANAKAEEREAAENKRKQEADDKRRAEEKLKKDKAVEDELAALKKRMGL